MRSSSSLVLLLLALACVVITATTPASSTSLACEVGYMGDDCRSCNTTAHYVAAGDGICVLAGVGVALEPTALAKALHNVHHRWSRHGGSIDDILDRPVDWVYDIALITGLVFVACVLYLFLDLFRLMAACCCRCCCSRQDDDAVALLPDGSIPEGGSCCTGFCNDNLWITKRGQRARWIIAAILLLGATASFALAIKASSELESTSSSLWDTARGVQQYKEGVLTHAHTLRDALDRTVVDVANIKAQTVTDPIKTAATDVEVQLQSAQTEFNSFLSSIPNTTWDKVIAEGKTQEKNVPWYHLGLFAMFVASALLLLGLTCRGELAAKSGCYCFAQFWSLFWLVITWLVVCAYVAVSAGIADSCMSPAGLITGAAQRWMTLDEQRLLTYYTQCTPHQLSPLQPRSDEAHRAISNATLAVGNMRTYAQAMEPALLPQINLLDGSIASANRSLTGLFSELDCSRVTPVLVRAVTLVCGDKSLLDNLTNLAVLIGCAYVLLGVARFLLPSCLCCRKRMVRYSPAVGGVFQSDIYGAVHPDRPTDADYIQLEAATRSSASTPAGASAGMGYTPQARASYTSPSSAAVQRSSRGVNSW